MTPLRRVLPVFAATLFVLMLIPGSALAQAPSVPRADLFGGAVFFNEEDSSLAGVHFSGAYRTGRHFGVVGDIAFYEQRTSYMGGVRVYGPASRVDMFGQFLVGSAPFDDIAFQPGLGVDVHISSRAAIRAAFDVKLSGDEGFYVGTRFSTGLVIKLGRQ
jgi:hypothetical protein